MKFCNSSLTSLYEDLGIDSLDKARETLRCWWAMGQPDLEHVLYMGSRDLCWHVSWLLEALEEGDDGTAAFEKYNPLSSPYLACKHGVNLYFDMWA